MLIPFLECHLVEGLSQLLKLPRVQYAFQREACECRTMIILLVVYGRKISLHSRCSRHNAGQTGCKASSSLLMTSSTTVPEKECLSLSLCSNSNSINLIVESPAISSGSTGGAASVFSQFFASCSTTIAATEYIA